jgi:hypothetical protein
MLFLLMGWQAAADLDTALDRYREKTRATIECDAGRVDDVLVCGHRAADKFRLPLIAVDPGDPKKEGVPVERERLLARTNNCEEMSTFLVGCGKVGVTMSTRTGLTAGDGERPIAP